MKKLIKQIATIRTGLFAKPKGFGEVAYLQARHFDYDGKLIAILQPDLMTCDISEKHLLKAGDILFAAKGTKNFAALFTNQKEAAVASTSFFVFRLTSIKILPEYLVWFLNNQTTQKLLKRKAIGTSIPSISKRVLEDLEIPIPSIDTQKAILQIIELRKLEKTLKHKIEVLRDMYLNQNLLKAINYER